MFVEEHFQVQKLAKYVCIYIYISTVGNERTYCVNMTEYIEI